MELTSDEVYCLSKYGIEEKRKRKRVANCEEEEQSVTVNDE